MFLLCRLCFGIRFEDPAKGHWPLKRKQVYGQCCEAPSVQIVGVFALPASQCRNPGLQREEALAEDCRQQPRRLAQARTGLGQRHTGHGSGCETFPRRLVPQALTSTPLILPKGSRPVRRTGARRTSTLCPQGRSRWRSLCGPVRDPPSRTNAGAGNPDCRPTTMP